MPGIVQRLSAGPPQRDVFPHLVAHEIRGDLGRRILEPVHEWRSFEGENSASSRSWKELLDHGPLFLLERQYLALLTKWVRFGTRQAERLVLGPVKLTQPLECQNLRDSRKGSECENHGSDEYRR